MAVITYPLLTVRDDSGTIVAGATVTVASVTDKAGTAIASPGATVNQAGANVSVDYDAEAKGEAWVTLSISKAGSTFTQDNASPSFYLARDSSRTLTALPAAAPGQSGGLPLVGSAPLSNLDAPVSGCLTAAGYTAPPSAAAIVSAYFASVLPTPRDITNVPDGQLTAADAHWASLAQVGGEDARSGTTVVFATPGGVAIRTATLATGASPFGSNVPLRRS